MRADILLRYSRDIILVQCFINNMMANHMKT
jgi:hypothetical protein